MPELFFQDTNSVSGRSVIFEDDGVAGWLYLTECNTTGVVADLWVYNRVNAPDVSTLSVYRGTPPPACKGYASTDSPTHIPLKWDASFLWSADGNAVALFIDDALVAHISLRKNRCFSKYVVSKGPWGFPWSQSDYDRVIDSDSIDFLS